MRSALVVLVSACAAATPVDCPVEGRAAAYACGSPFAIELGLGEEAFAPAGQDPVLGLVRGQQGLQHVDVAARLQLDRASLPTDRVLVGLAAWSLPDELEVVPHEAWGAGFVPATDPPELAGLRLVVVDPEPWLGVRLGVGLDVTPVGADETGTAWLEGTLEWAEAR